MLKYLQLPFRFNADIMQQEVAQLSNELWKSHYQKLHFTGDWSAIPLRSIDGKADNIIIAPTKEKTYEDTILLQACSYIRSVLGHFKCTLQAVRLLKLSAGAAIKEHRDTELNFENGEIRIHIPVVTHEDVEFILDKERMTLKEGECWYMNFNLPHYINNFSNTDRIHLVIDAQVNDWVKALFSSTAISNKKEIPEDSFPPSVQREIIARLREMNTATSNEMADKMEASLEKH